MGLFGKYQNADEILREFEQKLELEMAMVENGWRFWPAGASEEEKKNAIQAYIDYGDAGCKWYPPGCEAGELVTEGKLEVREGSRKKLFGLF